jgi:hypothetical protein
MVPLEHQIIWILSRTELPTSLLLGKLFAFLFTMIIVKASCKGFIYGCLFLGSDKISFVFLMTGASSGTLMLSWIVFVVSDDFPSIKQGAELSSS